MYVYQSKRVSELGKVNYCSLKNYITLRPGKGRSHLSMTRCDTGVARSQCCYTSQRIRSWANGQFSKLLTFVKNTNHCKTFILHIIIFDGHFATATFPSI